MKGDSLKIGTSEMDSPLQRSRSEAPRYKSRDSKRVRTTSGKKPRRTKSTNDSGKVLSKLILSDKVESENVPADTAPGSDATPKRLSSLDNKKLVLGAMALCALVVGVFEQLQNEETFDLVGRALQNAPGAIEGGQSGVLDQASNYDEFHKLVKRRIPALRSTHRSTAENTVTELELATLGRNRTQMALKALSSMPRGQPFLNEVEKMKDSWKRKRKEYRPSADTFVGNYVIRVKPRLRNKPAPSSDLIDSLKH